MLTHSSSIAVAATLWLLAAFSVATWALIVAKTVQFIRAGGANRRYVAAFRAAPNLQSAAEIPENRSGFARLAAVGFGVLRHAPPGEGDEHTLDRHELLERNLRQQVLRERRTLESGLAVLASVGSTAPFVGLFGTVWGIMSSFQAISEAGSTSLTVVAPGIAAALIATAAGLFAAIPAVYFYNDVTSRVKAMANEMEDFSLEFLTIAERNFT